MSIAVVYDTMLFLQAASRPDRLHTTFRAVREGRATLFISAELLAEIQDVLYRENMRARFPELTWETRILTLSSSSTHEAELLRQLAPQLAIITPKQFAEIVR